METRHLQRTDRLCILLLTDKIPELAAWIMLTCRWDKRLSTVLMFVDHAAVIRMLCFVSVIVFAKDIIPKRVVNYLKTQDITYCD